MAVVLSRGRSVKGFSCGQAFPCHDVTKIYCMTASWPQKYWRLLLCCCFVFGGTFKAPQNDSFQLNSPMNRSAWLEVYTIVYWDKFLMWCSTLSISWYYSDVIMSTIASQITGVSMVCSTVFFRRRLKTTSKLHVTGLCEWNPPVTGGFPSQRASNEPKCFYLMASYFAMNTPTHPLQLCCITFSIPQSYTLNVSNEHFYETRTLGSVR